MRSTGAITMNIRNYVRYGEVSALFMVLILCFAGCSSEFGTLSGNLINAGLKAGCNGCEIRRVPTEGETEGEVLEGELVEGENDEGEDVKEGEAVEEGEGDDVPDTMVAVQRGSFIMGRPYRDVGDNIELPVHEVSLDAYWMAKYEVTNREFAEALNWAYARKLLKNNEGTAYKGGTVYAYDRPIVETLDSGPNAQIHYSDGVFSAYSRINYNEQLVSMEEHPVVMVSWYGAAAYCNWRSSMNGLQPCYSTSDWSLNKPARNGYRLPTEAEWERAASWDGTKHWRYGVMTDSIDPAYANYAETNPLWLKSYPFTSSVGWYNSANPAQLRYPEVLTVNAVSPSGAYDMTGNVLEWCHDWFQDTYYTESPTSNPTGPAEGMFKSVRGGSWITGNPDCRTARRFRYLPVNRENDVGFRIIQPR